MQQNLRQSNRIASHAAALRGLTAARLGLGRGSLIRRAARARRMLPAAIRRDITRVAALDLMAANPRLAARIGPDAADRAYHNAARYLNSINVKERRTSLILSVLSTASFRFLAAVGLLLVVLHWRGFL